MYLFHKPNATKLYFRSVIAQIWHCSVPGYPCKPKTQEAKAGGDKFQASLGYFIGFPSQGRKKEGRTEKGRRDLLADAVNQNIF